MLTIIDDREISVTVEKKLKPCLNQGLDQISNYIISGCKVYFVNHYTIQGVPN